MKKTFLLFIILISSSNLVKAQTSSCGLPTCGDFPADPGIEIINSLKLRVFPNPSRGQFNVLLNEYSTTTVTITLADRTGKLVEKRTVQVMGEADIVNFDLSKKTPGLYIVTIISDKGKKSGKVLLIV